MRYVHEVNVVNGDIHCIVTDSPNGDRYSIPFDSLPMAECRRASRNLEIATTGTTAKAEIKDLIWKHFAGTLSAGDYIPKDKQYKPRRRISTTTTPAPSTPSVSAGIDLGIIDQAITTKVAEAVANIQHPLDVGAVTAIVNQAIEDAKLPVEYKFTVGSKPTVSVKGAHTIVPTIVRWLTAGLNVWMHGAAGNGKSTIASHVAEALSAELFEISLSTETSEVKLRGYHDAHGREVLSAIGRAVKAMLEGKTVVLFLDEISSARPDLTVWLNMVLANRKVELPSGTYELNDQFYILAAANDVGLGASVKYPKGKLQDASFRDRFNFVEVPIDMNIVNAVVASKCEDVPLREEWMKVWHMARTNVQTYGLNFEITPRSAIQGATLLGLGESMEVAIMAALLRGVSDQHQADKVLEGTSQKVSV